MDTLTPQGDNAHSQCPEPNKMSIRKLMIVILLTAKEKKKKTKMLVVVSFTYSTTTNPSLLIGQCMVSGHFVSQISSLYVLCFRLSQCIVLSQIAVWWTRAQGKKKKRNPSKLWFEFMGEIGTSQKQYSKKAVSIQCVPKKKKIISKLYLIHT